MEMGNLQKIAQFASQTGTSHKVAQEILQENGWNFEKAVKVYKYMSQAAAVPLGAQKNMDNLQGSWRTTALRPSPASTHLQLSGAKASTDQTKSDMINGQISNNSPSNTLNRRIKRGISTTANDAHIISIARDVLHTVQEGESNCIQGFIETPEYTFILPDISHYPDDFKAFLNKDLIETSTLVSLEQAGRLNWWADAGACQRLLPLATTGDGNCLLHAASLALWGFHDRLLTLRKALCQTMTSSSAKAAFFRRWRWHQTQINKQSGLIYSEHEWLEEWNNLAKLASAQPRIHPVAPPPATGRHSPAANSKCSEEERESADEETEVLYESLEELHVFVLAHVLRRTIIIIADTILKDSNGEALAPISFGGIYMPLECDASECHRSPLLLTYDAAHFSALVPMEDSGDSASSETIQLAAAVPLVDAEFELLPLHFTVDPGAQYQWNRGEDDEDGEDADLNMAEMSLTDRLNLLQKYMDIEQIPLPFNDPVLNGASDKPVATEDVFNGNSHSDSLGRTMSLESEDSSLSASNGKEKTTNGKDRCSNGKSTDEEGDLGWDKKKKDKGKLRNFVRSVGTLRRTLSRTFSRNFCASAKSGRRSDVKSEVLEKQQQNSKCTVQSVSPSAAPSIVTTTKAVINVVEWKGRDKLLCARLLHKRLDFQEEMIITYLKSAAERFQQEKDMLRQQDAELRHLTERRRQELELVQCVNSGCEGKASAATCYLCQECFERQKQEEFDMKMMHGNSPSSSTNQAPKVDRVDSGPSLPQYVPPGGIPHTQKHPSNGRQHETLSYTGKSKGYGTSNKNTSILRSRSQEEAIRNSVMSSGGGGGVGSRNPVMNNARPSSGTAPPNYATEVSHLLFYDTQDNCKTQMTRSSTIPAGTAIIVNNLYQSDNEALKKATNPPTGPNINLNCDWENVGDPLKYAQLGDVSNANMVNTCPENELEFIVSPWVSRDNLATMPVQQKCQTSGCDYYGTEATELLCSACFREKANRRNASLVSNKVVR